MRLSALSLRHFRNLGVQELTFPPEGVAILGENAQGKTNLLEAIYYLETFRSFRGSRDELLVAFDEEVFRVEGLLVPDGAAVDAEEDGPACELSAAYERKSRRKKVTLDGAERPRLGDALGKIGAVVFSPSDVSLVSDGPGERRRFLDIVLSLKRREYLESLQRFRHILSQRNAALRDEAPESVLHAWDEGMIEAGSAVTVARRDWVFRWGSAFADYYSTISGGVSARLSYLPSVRLQGGKSESEVADAYREALRGSGERERRLRTTVVGPHRDDLRMAAEEEDRELDLREYGSGGQQRTAALALRLVESATIRDERGHEPIVLLDDVFAELDPGRSERVLDLIEKEETGQVILTAPKDSDIRIRVGMLPRWRIQGGRLLT